MASIGARRAGKNSHRKLGEPPNRLAFINSEGGIMRALTFRERMREEAAKSAAAETADPWRLTLSVCAAKLTSLTGWNGLVVRRCSDLLEVPQRNRTAGTYRRLAKVMTELGWTAVRVRDLTRGGYKEQIRGYCREARGPHPARYS